MLLIFSALALLLLHGCSDDALPPDSLAVAELREAGRLSDASAARPGLWQSEAELWQSLPATTLELHPQRSVEPGFEVENPVKATLRARVDGEDLLLRIEWPDASGDRYSTDHTDRFADALAVQFASDGGDTLPYVGMGEPQRPVRLWFWRAGRDVETLTARGFGTLEPDPGARPPAVETERTADGWSVTLRGPLPEGGDPLALALAVWDGSDAGRDGRKRLSAWHLLRLPNRPLDALRTTALGVESRSDGDPRNGARLVSEHGCTTCHRIPGHAAPPVEAGPDLTSAGGIHWPGYLHRAIAKPTSFIVPGKGYAATDQAGRPTSLMPSLELPPAAVEDLVAYLATL